MAALLDATNATPQALVGTRIRDDNDFRGTIRYVGPVATSTKDPNATWYGVEWDDNTRGKHDGAVEKDSQEIRYFTCPAGAGSFVKPKKVDRGSSLVEALRQKYVGLDAPVEAPLGVEANEADSRDFLKGSTEQTKRNGEEITRGTFEHKAYTKRGTSRRPAVLWCLHAIDATRVHLTMKWVVSFSILGPFGPSRATTMLTQSFRTGFQEIRRSHRCGHYPAARSAGESY